MRIGLFGIYGVYNFGCEAIVRGTLEFLKLHEPSCQVTYYSFNYEYDLKMLNDLDIQVVKVENNNNILKKIINKLMWITKYDGCLLPYDYKKILNNSDALYFIGGDIYTIPAINREKKVYRYINSLVEFGKKATAKGIPIILYGASVGPFGDFKKAINYYKKALRSYKMIVCREEVSINYLKTLSLDNLLFSPDPAFLVENKKNNCKTSAKYIGVNLSPLSLNEIYGSNNQEQIIKFSSILLKIYEEFGKDILLLPHVISNDPRDNDYEFMKKIIDTLDEKDKKHFIIADSENGFLGIKEQILNCSMVVSARMHCAINAIHENVPTIFLSYSQKSIGMCKYIYGNEKWVIDIKKVEELLLGKMKQMMIERDSIINLLTLRNEEIKKSIRNDTLVIRKELFGSKNDN